MSATAWLLIESSHDLFWVQEESVTFGGALDVDFKIDTMDSQLKLRVTRQDGKATITRLGSKHPILVNDTLLEYSIDIGKEARLRIVSDEEAHTIQLSYLEESSLPASVSRHRFLTTFVKDPVRLVDAEAVIKTQLGRLHMLADEINASYALHLPYQMTKEIHEELHYNGVIFEITDDELWVTSEQHALKINGQPVMDGQLYVGDELAFGKVSYQITGQSTLVREPFESDSASRLSTFGASSKLDMAQPKAGLNDARYCQPKVSSLSQRHEDESLEQFRAKLHNWLAWQPVEPPLFDEIDYNEAFANYSTGAQSIGVSEHQYGKEFKDANPDGQSETLFAQPNAGLQWDKKRFFTDSVFEEEVTAGPADAPYQQLKDKDQSLKTIYNRKLPMIHKVMLATVLALSGTLLGVLLAGS